MVFDNGHLLTPLTSNARQRVGLIVLLGMIPLCLFAVCRTPTTASRQTDPARRSQRRQLSATERLVDRTGWPATRSGWYASQGDSVSR